MPDVDEITRLRADVEHLTAENAALREDGFRGSKAEALMALEYDRIPNVLKTPRAITMQRKIATAVMIIVPMLIVLIVVVGGWNAYQDRQRSAEVQKASAELGDYLREHPPQVK